MSDGTWEIPGGETVRKATQIERVLRDLIAELRAAHHPTADLDGEPRRCVQGCGILPCHSLSAAASAEARLREVQR